MSLKFLGIIAGLLVAVSVTAQSGGPYELTQSVSRSGAVSVGGSYSMEATAGQAVAGNLAPTGTYLLSSGFWTPPDLAPTAATVTIGGRILTAEGLGIRNAVVTLTSFSGLTRTVTSGSFGVFHFDEVPVGENYILTVHGRRHTFAEPTRILSVSESVTGLDFIADAPFDSDRRGKI